VRAAKRFAETPVSGLSRLRAGRSLLVFVATLGLLGLLLGRFAEPGELLAAFERIAPAKLALPFLLSGAALFLSALRWKTLLRGLGHDLPYRSCLFAVIATWPIAVLTPSRSGDALRAALVRNRVPLAAGLGSVLVEKLIDLQSLGVLLAAGAVANGRYPLVVVTLAVVAAFWVGLFLAPEALRRAISSCAGERFRARLEATAGALSRLRRARGPLGAVVAMSIGAWLLTAAIVHELLVATGQDVPPGDLLLAWPAAVVASAIPLAFSGVGARDGVFLGLLASIRPGIDPAATLTATLLYPAVTSWTFAVIGLPFTVRALAADPDLRRWGDGRPPREEGLVGEGSGSERPVNEIRVAEPGRETGRAGDRDRRSE
jgi:uncharacterized protein (TIRG00374 family)